MHIFSPPLIHLRTHLFPNSHWGSWHILSLLEILNEDICVVLSDRVKKNDNAHNMMSAILRYPMILNAHPIIFNRFDVRAMHFRLTFVHSNFNVFTNILHWISCNCGALTFPCASLIPHARSPVVSLLSAPLPPSAFSHYSPSMTLLAVRESVNSYIYNARWKDQFYCFKSVN